MKTLLLTAVFTITFSHTVLTAERLPEGTGTHRITGELKQGK